MFSAIITSILNFFHKFDSGGNEGLMFLNSGYRATDLAYCYDGLIKTGQPLLGCTNNNFFLADAIGDDVGQYYFLPKLFNLLNLSSGLLQVNTYQRIFYLLIVCVSFFIGCLGISLIYQQKTFKIISYIYLIFLSFFYLYVLSTFTFYFFIISFVPLIIFILNKYIKNKSNIYYVFFAFIGLMISLSNKFRGQAGTGVLLFTAIYLLLFSKKVLFIKDKFIILIILFIFSNSLNLYFYYILKNRNEWLIKNNYSYLIKGNTIGGHPFWHALYLGLSYVQSEKYKILWNDFYGYYKANRETSSEKKWNPHYIDEEYESFMKKEFLTIFKNDPFFIIENIIYKTKKILLSIIISMNFGLIFVFFKKTDKKILISFLIPIIFYLLPGILIWPDARYILGGICMSILFSIFVINDFLTFVKKSA